MGPKQYLAKAKALVGCVQQPGVRHEAAVQQPTAPQARPLCLMMDPGTDKQPFYMFGNGADLPELLKGVWEASGAVPLSELFSPFLERMNKLLPPGMSVLEPLVPDQAMGPWDQSACMPWKQGEVVAAKDKQAGIKDYGKGYKSMCLPGTTTWVPCHQMLMLAVWGPVVEVQEGEQQPAAQSSGWVVMHLCENPRCLNPLHLAWGNYSENRLRVEKGDKAQQSKLDAKKGKIHQEKTRIKARRVEWWLKWEAKAKELAQGQEEGAGPSNA